MRVPIRRERTAEKTFGRGPRACVRRVGTSPPSSLSAPSDLAGVRLQHAEDDARSGGLAGPAGAHEPERLPLATVTDRPSRATRSPTRRVSRCSCNTSSYSPRFAPGCQGLDPHLSSGPGRRRPAGGGTRRPPRVVQGRTWSGLRRTPHGPSAVHCSARMPGMKNVLAGLVITNRGSPSPPAERFARDGEGAGAVVGRDQRVLHSTEPDEVASLTQTRWRNSNWRVMLAPMIRKVAPRSTRRRRPHQGSRTASARPAR
jgi:hypothetical protein